MNYLESRRYGRFQISLNLMSKMPTFIMKQVMANFLITRAEHTLWLDVIEYEGYSRFFRKLEDGEAAPLYMISYDSDTSEIIVAEV